MSSEQSATAASTSCVFQASSQRRITERLRSSTVIAFPPRSILYPPRSDSRSHSGHCVARPKSLARTRGGAMQVHRYERARSRTALLLWVAAALALGAATLGLVHHASVRRVRHKADTEPLRARVVIELGKRHGTSDSSSDLEPWRAVAKGLGRELETFSGASLADIPTKRFAAWVLVDQKDLSDADFAALDSY